MKIIRFMFFLILLGILTLVLLLNHTSDIETVQVVKKAAPKIRDAVEKDIEKVKTKAEAVTEEAKKLVEEENKESDMDSAKLVSMSVVEPEETAEFSEENEKAAFIEDASDDNRHLSAGDALRVIRALKGKAEGDD